MEIKVKTIREEESEYIEENLIKDLLKDVDKEKLAELLLLPK